MSDPASRPAPSYEELAALVVEQARTITELRTRITELEAENARLRARLDQTSANSSKPPSADTFVKPSPTSQRRRSGRKPGGQNGHPGSTLKATDSPDEVVVHEPAQCGGCGTDLAHAPATQVMRRQVVDIPPITPTVTEHRMITKTCACGARTRAAAPAGVNAPVSYGARVRAIICYLYLGQFLSKQRCAQALSELLGTPVSTGTVASAAARCAQGLEAFGLVAAEHIASAPVAHFDETSLRVAGGLAWVHSASTHKWTLVTVHPRRGRAGMDAAGVLPAFGGVAVHDAWAPYDTYGNVASHALCNAHLLRNLQAVIDAHPQGEWCWAQQAQDALRAMKKLVDAHLRTASTLVGLDQGRLGALVHQWRSAAVIGREQTAPRSSEPMRKFHALAKRMLARQGDYLRFTVDARVPFDNNEAERQIRMVKLRQKVSGCLRSLVGAEQFCRVRSYLATAAKNGVGAFDALVRLAEGRAWVPENA